MFWYARFTGLKFIGPFTSEVEAVEAVTDADGLPAQGAFVWPSKKKIKVRGAPKTNSDSRTNSPRGSQSASRVRDQPRVYR